MAELTIPELTLRLAAAEEALRRGEIRATVGQLALEMIHEIRNPLEALSHLTFLARQNAEEPDKVRAYLDLAEEQMAHLRYVSGKTLGYSQPTLSFEAVDLVKVAEAALRIHRRTFERNKIQLVKDLPDQLVAPIHFSEMLQVISNLLSNALDAVPGAGSIRLRVSAWQNEAHIVVADNGHGIPPEHLQTIFKPYFTTRGDRGTGIGLALVEKIVAGHRGRIRVRSSVKPGRSGTIFRVSVPAHPQVETAVEQ